VKKKIGFWVAALALMGLFGFGLTSCNVAESGDAHILRMQLDDSLAVESNLFKTVDIDLFDSSGNMTHANVFSGPYSQGDSAKLANLVLTSKIPNPVTIRVTAYKNNDDYWIFTIQVADGVRKVLPPVHKTPSDPVDPDPVDSQAPNRIIITSPTTSTLYLGDPSISLSASAEPPTAVQTVTWTLSSGDAAILESGDKLKALKAGTVTLTATSILAPSVTATLVMTVTNAPTVLPASVVINNASPLSLTVGGASVALNASVLPVEAKQDIKWTLPSNTVAALEPGNQIKGLKAGTVTLTASSAIAPSVFGTLVVTVQDAPTIMPDSISLRMATPMVLAVGGADIELAWTVLPSGVDQGVDWTSSDTAIAQIMGGNKIRPLKKGTAKVTGKSKAKPAITTTFDVNVIVPVKVDAISILPKTLTLYSGGPEGKLAVTLTGNDSGAQYTLSSSEDLIASVSAAGSVKGLAAGSAIITAAVVGYPAITSACTVQVIKDSPVVTVSPNQNVAFNGEAEFTVFVGPQAYGTTVEIKADMDGDNVFEQTVLNKDTAVFKQKYPEVKVTTVTFKVKDTEGNEVTITRKVTVGAPGAPIVSIVNPSKDTTINVLSLKIRFNVKDTALKTDIFVDSTVSLIAGSNKVRAARTNVGGAEGSDEVTILVDNVAPAVAISGPTTQITGTAAFSLSGTSNDLESGLLSVSVSGAMSGNGAATLTAGNWSKGGLTLKEGGNSLVATATDKAGNTKTASITVTLDSKVPDAVSFVGVDGAFTADDTPTWSWTSSTVNPGNGTFVLKLDAGPEFDGGSAKTFTPTTPLSDNATHTLTVKERDQVPGVTGPAKSFSFKVKVSPPAAPTVKSAVATLANNGTTNNPGFTWTSGGGGNGKFRMKLNTETTYRINGVAVKLWSLAATDPDGTYSIHVSEQDDLGRWGEEGHFAIKLDRTGPTYSMIRIKGSTLDLRDGYITNADELTISYTSDGAPKEFTCILSKDDASNDCSQSNQDALGNTSIMRRNIIRKSKVVFFKPTASGTMDGSSWENARSDLADYLALDNSTAKDLWLASGNYSNQNPNIFFKWNNIYGGFDASKFPTDLNNRTKNNTLIGTIALFGAETLGTFDGLRMTKGMSADGVTQLNIVDCQFLGRISFTSGSKISIKNGELTGVSHEYSSLAVSGAEVTWDGGRISGNNPTDAEGYAIITDPSGSLTFKGNLTISGNGNPNIVGCPGCQFMNEGKLTISSPVSVACNTIVNRGTGSCLGNPLP